MFRLPLALALIFTVFVASALPAQESPAPTGTAPDLMGLMKRMSVNGNLSSSFSYLDDKGANKGTLREQGVIGDLWLRGTIEGSEHVRGEVSSCYGCHGIELESAFVEFQAAPQLHVRAGRFVLPFGPHGGHAHSTRASVTHPLGHGMGQMVHGEDYNQGVLPAPAVDNGFGLFGQFDVKELSFGYDLYLVRGFKGLGNDFDFVGSRDFEDNNGDPAFGGRLSFGLAGLANGLDGGISATTGTWDSDSRYQYFIAEADLRLRMGALTMSVEHMFRRTEFLLGSKEDEFYKRSWYASLGYDLGSVMNAGDLRIYGAVEELSLDGIAAGGGGLTASSLAAITDFDSSVLRLTAGFDTSVAKRVLFRFATELWDFSELKDAVVVRGELVWSF